MQLSSLGFLNTVCKELFAGVVFTSSASLVWQDFQKRYNKIDGCRIFEFTSNHYFSHSSQLSLMEPLHSINQVYSMLVQEESQCKLSFTLLSASAPTALYSSATPTGPSKRKFLFNFKFIRKKHVASHVISLEDLLESDITYFVKAHLLLL
ncbi:hypothetical protein J1N35_010107 [Gossypium stocksii]|uniref:Uncharacterized protein n=1 Tax=Gossypium stocksii TaxID=47602 RepID=A0A9D3VZS5_9ROSI|nr:hypothetical protein J1N35_010107 [Gossypium stocksii]